MSASDHDRASAPRDLTKDLRRVQHLARIMDSAIAIPGTHVRLGIDALLGLFPGAGDALSAGIAAYPVMVAVRYGVPNAVVLRLLGNIALDALAGSIPILGDLFDIGFRANMRNQRLIEQYAAQPTRATRRSKAVLWLALGAMALVIAGVIALGIWAFSALVGALSR